MFVRLHVRGLRLSVCLNTILMVEAQLQGVGWHEHLLGVVLGVREIFLSRESSKYVDFEQQFDPHSATRICFEINGLPKGSPFFSPNADSWPGRPPADVHWRTDTRHDGDQSWHSTYL